MRRHFLLRNPLSFREATSETVIFATLNTVAFLRMTKGLRQNHEKTDVMRPLFRNCNPVKQLCVNNFTLSSFYPHRGNDDHLIE